MAKIKFSSRINILSGSLFQRSKKIKPSKIRMIVQRKIALEIAQEGLT